MDQLDQNDLMKEYQAVTQLDATIFRAYDVRGDVATQLTPNVVYTLGLAIAHQAYQRNVTSVAVGRDGRLSSPELSKALIAGLITGGCDVLDLGLVPTPVLYFAASQQPNRSGVMLTGSHNPKNYNGIKLVLQDQVLAEQAILDLYRCIVQQQWQARTPGTVQTCAMIDDYIDYIVQNHPLARPLKIVIDCGHGATGVVAPQLFNALGCDVQCLYEEVDGNFPHHHPDPSKPENLEDLIQAMRDQHADIGLAFDGDGDRLGVVTDQSEIICPDRQMMLFAQHALAQHSGAEVIFDVKCSRHLSEVIRNAGGTPVMWKTGHALLRRKLQEQQALLAGEMSGHIYFNDDAGLGFDDGLYAGVRLLEILAASDQTVHQCFAALPNSLVTPELVAKVDDKSKFALIEVLQRQAQFREAELITIDGLRVEFANGWGLVRASNTTPTIIFRFEADDEAALQSIQQQFRTELLRIVPDLSLPF